MLYNCFSLMMIHRVGHTYCGFFSFLSEVKQFLFTTFFGHLCMHICVYTHIHTNSAKFCQQTTEIFKIQVFLINDFKD